MNKRTYILLALLIVLMTACSIDDDRVASDCPVEVSLSLSVAGMRQVATRQPAVVVQADGNYRGLTDWHVIPFEVRNRKIAATDLAKRERLGSMDEKFDKSASRFFYTEHCEFMNGVASFLVYARAIPTYGTSDEPTMAQKSVNGTLTAVFPADMNPVGFNFSPTPIHGTSTPHSKATSLASYLTAIANTSATIYGTAYQWSDFSTPAFKVMYQNFIGQENVKAMDIAASSTNVLKYVNELYHDVNSLKASYPEGSTERRMCEEIQKTIKDYTGVTFSEGKVTSLGEAMSGYPANIGLPDGAAVVRWTGSAFTPQTQATTMDNITGITRYAYPAELYYYANSLIKTSTSDGKRTYYGSKNTWDDVLSQYEYDKGALSPDIKAVAIIDPLQYGVAHLEVMLKKVATTTVKDAADADITIGTSDFPLTALITGNQHPVGFDFKPNSADDYCMYDPNVTSGVCLSSSDYPNSGEVSAVTHTLVLQSNDDEEIAIVLEFQNNSTQTIEGVDHGLIYPGTKFYLVAKVKPDAVTAGADDYKKRVFTQDRITTMTMQVKSLAKAYNVLPNLLSPRLEIGVQVVTDWMQAEPTNVLLE